MNRFGLTFAVPRGALFAGTLGALDRIGIDTAAVRGSEIGRASCRERVCNDV